jgi:hypothetical protein
MELIVMLLAPFPIGFLVRNRMAAFLAYIALNGFVFTVQTLTLLVEWVGGKSQAFGPYPAGSNSEVIAYAVVNLVIFAVGLGLVYLGHRLGTRRRSRAVDLEPAA